MKKFVLYFILLTVFTLPGYSANANPLPYKYLWDQTRITNLSLDESGAEGTDSVAVIRVGKPLQDTLVNGKGKRIKEVAKAKPQAKPEKIKPAVNRPPTGNPEKGRPAVPGKPTPAVRPRTGGQGAGARPAQGGTRPQPAPTKRGP